MRNKMKLHKYLLSIAVIFVFVFSSSSIANANNTDTGSSDLKVSYHTKAEIANYINNHPYSNAYVNNFSSTPKTSAPYAWGSLASSTQNDSLTLLNTIRYIAGLPSNVTLNSDYINYAQAASVVDAANNVLSHYPAQPSGMSNDMFQLGYDGAGSSNLAMGFESLGSAMIDGWMSDGDDSNIDRVGHRRWVLNPSMAQTGFGLAYTSDGSYPYSAMYSIDGGNSDGKYYNVVAWPAQNTPSDFFQKNDPWTISFNEYVLNASVTVTNNNTGKSWSFSGTPNCCISNDSGYYFNINNDGYGQIGCIIFRPDNISVSNGNSYSVSLSGEVADEEWAYSEQDGWYISWKSGTERNINISYTVDFFDTQYYLNPNVEYVTVTFSPNGADEIESSITIEKNTAYGSFPTVTRSGFDFVGWYTLPEGGNKVETTDICSQDITLYAHWVVNSSTQYTEKYYTEGLDGNYVLYKSEIKYGEAGSELPIENKNYEGFKLTRITGSVYILEDGSSVKEYYYTRNTYSITWDFDGGNNGNDNNTDSYKYEESITVPTSLTKEGYYLSGWDPSVPSKMPAENLKIKAKWSPRTNTKYTVKHYKQTLDGDYTTPYEFIKAEGTTDASITPEVREYEGFTSPSAITTTIKPDGSTLVEYKYKRNSYALTIDGAGGSVDGYTYRSKNVLFDSPLNIGTPERNGYIFAGWDVEVPKYMPAHSLTITATWTKNSNSGDVTSTYTVEHYKEGLDGEYEKTTETFSGIIGSSVSPSVKYYIGFTSPTPKSVTIESDGSTLVQYYYDRKTYTLTFNYNGGNVNGVSMTIDNVKYEAPIEVKIPERQYYIFDGWDVEIPKTMPAENLRIRALWKEDPSYADVSYKVEHYQEQIDGEMVLVSEDTETFTAMAGSSVTPDVKTYNGFLSSAPKTVTVSADGSTVVQYYYTRKTYTLIWDLNGGSASGNYTGRTNSGKVMWGVSITEPKVSKEGYTFAGWDIDVPDTMPMEDLTITAQWIEKSNEEETASYRVEHYKENLDGTYSIVSSDTQTKIGYVGSSVTPAVKTYTGFDSPSAKEVFIKADGSTVVEYKYTRKSYKLTWDLNGGSASGNYSSGYVKYGTKITVPTVSKTNYIFDSWDVEIPTTMPAQDLTIKANWAEQIVSYTVKHFKENLDGSYSIVSSDTLNKTASAGSKVTPAVNRYSGFESPSERQFTIRSDGSTVAEYYYKRKTYVLTWNLNGGSASGGYTSGSVKYGAKITVPRVSKTNCIFDSWDVKVPSTMPAQDLTIKANWADLIVSYKVEHYQQNLDGTYTLMTDDTQILTGKAGSTVSPERMDYPGFSAGSQTVTIKADGSTLVQFKYSRNLINLTWNFAGGSSKGSYSYGYIKYGEKITAPTVTKKGYIFDGWDVEVPATMPAKPLTITAKWKEDTSNNNNNNLKHIEAKEPTCDKDGNKEYWYSEEQGKYYSDENGQNEIVKDRWVITALGHKWNNGVVTKEATETAEGTMLFTCERCSESYTDSIPVKGHEHNLKYVNAKAATCAKAGNSEYWYCDKCGKYYSDKNASKQIAKDSYIIAATGHKWDSGVVTKEATENAEGEKTFTCSACGEKYTESIPKLEPVMNPVKAFVTRFYTIILQREEINDEEIEYYTSRLLSHELDGCSVAKGFVMSPEYIGKGDSDLDFVKKMYAAFFNREADAAQYYCDILASGQTREVVLAGFVNSPEFKALCADYGINPGELIIDPQNNNQGNNQGNNGENGNNQGNPSDDVTKLNLDTTNVNPDKLDAYVKNLYVQILGREYDEGGLQYWKEQIMAGTTYDAATAARVGFFESPEYQGKNKNSEQFVTDCYHAFLGREPEPDGLSYWMKLLDSGEYSKQKVIDLGFGHSNEFKGILTECGFRIIE